MFPKGIYIVCIDQHGKLKLYSARTKYIMLELLNSLCYDTPEEHSCQDVRSPFNASERSVYTKRLGKGARES